jgi:pSer/pThr/pTyr-binding forkhead associated (FHA) protein
MLASARFRLPDGSVVTAGPGAVIGRAFTADVRLDDGRVSEAHALVSLRGGEVVVFALRGRVRVDGRDVTRVALTDGLLLELAPAIVLAVEAIELPDALLAL